MIDPAHELSITNQAEALNISRGSVYYLPRPVPDADLTIMRRLDRCIWSSLSRARGCCKACWSLRGTRSAGVT